MAVAAIVRAPEAATRAEAEEPTQRQGQQHRRRPEEENAVRKPKRQVRILRSSLDKKTGRVLRADDGLVVATQARGGPHVPIPEGAGCPHPEHRRVREKLEESCHRKRREAVPPRGR